MSRKTGPAPRFSIDDAVSAALDIGIDRFTIASVGKRLDVTPPALYRVVSSREELLDLCFRRVLTHLELPDASRSWQDQLRDFANAMWSLCERFPGLPLAIVNSPAVHDRISSSLMDIVRRISLASCPLTQDAILFALDFLADTVCMTHIGIVPMRETGDDGLSGLERVQQSYRAAAVSGGTAAGFAGTAFVMDDSWVERGFLDRKIEFIVAGLEAGVHERS